MSAANSVTNARNTPVQSVASLPTGSLAAPSTSSVLKHTKIPKHIHWWYFGPVVLALVMFLLMGTIFERRIEGFWRRILERRQATLAQTIESEEPALNTNSLHTVKTPSQRTIGSCKAGTTTAGDNEAKLETKSFCCNHMKKEYEISKGKDEDLNKKEL